MYPAASPIIYFKATHKYEELFPTKKKVVEVISRVQLKLLKLIITSTDVMRQLREEIALTTEGLEHRLCLITS